MVEKTVTRCDVCEQHRLKHDLYASLVWGGKQCVECIWNNYEERLNEVVAS